MNIQSPVSHTKVSSCWGGVLLATIQMFSGYKGLKDKTRIFTP